MVYRRRYLSGQSATTVMIEEKAVTSDKIGDKAVDTPQLADDAVTTEKILDGEVKTEDIGAQAVQTPDIKDLAVTGPKIADSTIPLSKLAFTPSTRPLTPGVDTPEIQDAKVTEAKLASDSVSTVKIKDGNVTQPKLAGDAVETVNIKDGNVTQPKLASGSVGNLQIDANAVRGTEIQDGAVGTGKLSTDAVETVKIKDANVTEPKLEQDILSKTLYNRQLFHDDFLGVVVDDAWRKTGEAGGSVILVPLSQVQIQTDNDINDSFRLDWGAIKGLAMSAGAGRFLSEVLPSAGTNEVFFVGVYDNANNFVGFRLDTSVSNNWFAVSKSAGVETSVDTGLVIDLVNPVKLEILYPSPGSDIEFRVDDVLKTTITTNKFTTAGLVRLYVETLENVAKALVVDLVFVSWDR